MAVDRVGGPKLEKAPVGWSGYANAALRRRRPMLVDSPGVYALVKDRRRCAKPHDARQVTLRCRRPTLRQNGYGGSGPRASPKS